MDWNLTCVNSESYLRILSWQDKALYASRRYTLLRCFPEAASIDWSVVGCFKPAWWRYLSASTPLTYRLCRDGFHGLVALSSGHLVASVPGAIVTLLPGESEFRVSHQIKRGTRPLNLTVTNDDRIFWGEYFRNSKRDEVHIYGSEDCGESWEVVYTFPRQTVRHIHNIVYDRWENCLWILTGDYGAECKIIRASCDFKEIDIVISSNQQARAVAMVPTENALYFATDTPLDNNYVYRLDRCGKLEQLAALSSSSLSGCLVSKALFFSTMVEPSLINLSRNSHLYGSLDGLSWKVLLEWHKDHWPMTLFQFGNIILPGGNNNTELLAFTTVALEGSDLQTTIWRIFSS